MEKPLVWLHTEVKSPPLSKAARVEAGELLRELQQGASLAMPHSRPTPSVGHGCHELRISDRDTSWRLFYRVDEDAIVIAGVFGKRTQRTPRTVIDIARRRLRMYDAASCGRE